MFSMTGCCFCALDINPLVKQMMIPSIIQLLASVHQLIKQQIQTLFTEKR